MSAEQIQAGQGTFTAEDIRRTLDTIEAGGAGEHDYDRVADLLNATVRLRGLAEQLQREIVADVRSITGPDRVKPPVSTLGRPTVAVRRTGDTSPHRYGWDFIGWCLGASKQAMAQRFGS